MDRDGGCGLRTTCSEGGARSRNPLPAQALGTRCRRAPARLSRRMRNPGNRNGQGGAGPNGLIMPGPAQTPPEPRPPFLGAPAGGSTTREIPVSRKALL